MTTRYSFRVLSSLFIAFLAFRFLFFAPVAKMQFIREAHLGPLSVSGSQFPNILSLLPVSWGIEAFAWALFLYALTLFWQRLWPWTPLILLYSWFCLFDARLLPPGPGFIMTAAALICFSILGFLQLRKPLEHIPARLLRSMWFVLALTSLMTVLRNGFQDLPRLQPGEYLQLAAVALLLPAQTRGIGWLIHLVIFAIQGEFGALAYSLLLFDSRWIPARKIKPNDIVVFFDGYCGLCSRSVDFLMAEDTAAQLRYAPLQGPTADRLRRQGHLPFPEVEGVYDSLLIKIHETVYYRSEGLLRLSSYLPGIWRFGVILRFIPLAARDRIYTVIAKNRYRLFGKSETCRLPTPEERSLFI